MSSAGKSVEAKSASSAVRAAGVIVVSSVMFTFISSWRTAAIVLSDLGSTAYYIGGIVEQAIGPSAPWFVLAVMLFSYAVRSVYIESVSMFVRGGVYRVTREALGGVAAKVAVSALLFDYVLTGPISSVSAGQYVSGLILELASLLTGHPVTREAHATFANLTAMFLAVAVTLYFYRLNLIGIHESSDKALKILKVTTVMAVLVIGWGLVTLCWQGPRNHVPLLPDLTAKMNYTLGQQHSPLGFIENTWLGHALAGLRGSQFFSLLGVLGLFVAFGHSILAMSGEETLAQVYREVEAPKLLNFKKSAFIVFLYSLIFTGGICWLAVLLIPDEVRMPRYADNLIGGLAMSVIGPMWARVLLNVFVVFVGFLILSAAVNTAMIGSNGVLNRLAEDGVVPYWFQKPHRRFGTTHRILTMIVILQLGTILVSGGDVIILGEAYAFGVVWSFVLMTASMLVLRFKNRMPREYRVPLNLRWGQREIPIGLGLIFLVLGLSALANLLTKETATKWGLGFTLAFLSVFLIAERLHKRQRRGAKHEHLEQFNCSSAESLSRELLGLNRRFCKLVAIRSPNSMAMLKRSLDELDPETTDLVVMTARMTGGDDAFSPPPDLTGYDQQLMTAVVQNAELAGKQLTPLIVPTNNPLHAVLRSAAGLRAQEVVFGASNKYTAEEQLDLITLYWLSLHGGDPVPLTVRIVSRNRDLSFDLAGGNRIPTLADRKSRSVAELRAARVGVNRVLVIHDGSQASHDLYQTVLTMLDDRIGLTLIQIPSFEPEDSHLDLVEQARLQAERLRRRVDFHRADCDLGAALVDRITEGGYDLVVLSEPEVLASDGLDSREEWLSVIRARCPCPVLVGWRSLPLSVTDD